MCGVLVGLVHTGAHVQAVDAPLNSFGKSLHDGVMRKTRRLCLSAAAGPFPEFDSDPLQCPSTSHRTRSSCTLIIRL